VKIVLTTESGKHISLIERLTPDDFYPPASEWLMAQLREAVEEFDGGGEDENATR